MIENSFQKNILVPLLEHFVGNHVFGVKMEEDSVIFKTEIGTQGLISKNTNGDWDIIIRNEVIYEVEDELFGALMPSKGRVQLDEYYEKLNALLTGNLKYRSKVLVIHIVKTLEYFILNTQINPRIPIKVGPFLVFTSKIMGKNILCLN